MIGLLIKDILTLKKYARTMAFLVAIYSIWGYVSDNPMLISSFVTIFFSMICVTSISYDENAQWNAYALTMPLSRGALVMGKYVLGILFNLSGALISSLASLCVALVSGMPSEAFLSFLENLAVTVISSSFIGFLFLAIYLPFLYWLGVEKSRVIMISIFLVPSILAMLLFKMAPQAVTHILSGFSSLQASPALLLLLLALVFAMVAASYLISLHIFKKKEF